MKASKTDSWGDLEGDVRLSPDVEAIVSVISDITHVLSALHNLLSSPRTFDGDSSVCAADC